MYFCPSLKSFVYMTWGVKKQELDQNFSGETELGNFSVLTPVQNIFSALDRNWSLVFSQTSPGNHVNKDTCLIEGIGHWSETVS